MSEYQPSNPCTGELKDARVAPPDLLDVLDRIRDAVLDNAVAPVEVARRLRELAVDAEAMPVAEDIECGYDGEVDDPHYHRLAEIVSWVCPRCGEDREEDAPGPDPDRAYDEMRDARDEGRL